MTGRLQPALTAAALATGIIVAEFGLTAAPWSDVLRAVLVVTVFSLLLGVVASRVLAPSPAVFVAVLLTVAVVRPVAAPLVMLAPVAMLAVSRWRRILGWGDSSNRKTIPPVAVFAGVFAVAGLISAVLTHGLPQVPGPSRAVAAGPGGESVYVVMLDGYPRSDTLHEDFDYDNEPFLQALEARGFDVDRDRATAYPHTGLALAHLLNVDLTGIPIENPSPAAWREVRRRLSDAPQFADWRAAGYEVTVIRSAIGHTTLDGSLDTGQINEFEVAVLGNSLLAPFVRGWIMDQQRERLDAGFDALVELARTDRSKVVLAHLLAPHPPFLTRPAPACWPGCGLWQSTGLSFTGTAETYAAAVRAQLDYLNPRVLATLDAIIEADPGAAIVVFSDHGFRHRPVGDPDWHRNLYALRGQPSVVVPGLGR